MEETSNRIFNQLGLNNENLQTWESLYEYDKIPDSTKVIEKGEPLFVRLDLEEEVSYIKEQMSKKQNLHEYIKFKENNYNLRRKIYLELDLLNNIIRGQNDIDINQFKRELTNKLEEMENRFTVDRIENDIAILENRDTGEMLNVNKRDLPQE